MRWDVEYTDEFEVWWRSRVAILLIGGDKTGKDDWYAHFVPIADKIYAKHLQEIGKE